jgi:hypothetical protein
VFGDQGNAMVRLIAAGTSDSLLPGAQLQAGDIYDLVGTGAAGSSGIGGPAPGAEISHPSGLVVDAGGSLLVSDQSDVTLPAAAVLDATLAVKELADNSGRRCGLRGRACGR